MSIKIPRSFFPKIEKSVLKFIWKHKSHRIAKTIISKESSAGVITILDFKLCHSTLLTKIADAKSDTKASGTEDPEIKLCNYSYLIFDKGAKDLH
jgi:hypothetical protein